MKCAIEPPRVYVLNLYIKNINMVSSLAFSRMFYCLFSLLPIWILCPLPHIDCITRVPSVGCLIGFGYWEAQEGQEKARGERYIYSSAPAMPRLCWYYSLHFPSGLRVARASVCRCSLWTSAAIVYSLHLCKQYLTFTSVQLFWEESVSILNPDTDTNKNWDFLGFHLVSI